MKDMPDWIILLLVGAVMALLSPLAIVVSYDWAWGALLAGIIVMVAAFVQNPVR